MKFVGGL